ncbi:MAG: DEAD/DEAH box helicase [Oscillospiraceae bacterium]|nr:MAG: DEAD/DEAH box helicase [Oscillospiraceae bacterium]
MTFQQLHLMPQLLRAVEQEGYLWPTPIQQRAIPPALRGRDLLGCAQTGTGKTAAFALPILQRLSEEKDPRGKRRIRALILTPTRELALQIHENIVSYGRELPLHSAVIFGGVSQNPQTEELARGVDVLVATPGRLLDLMNQGFIRLDSVGIFVLDEADRMLDMGFIHDVRRVIATLPERRQTMLFSATMPQEIAQLAASMLHNPERIAVAPPATTVELIEQAVYLTDKAKKRNLLVWLLQNRPIDSALVFTRTKHGADRVCKVLNGAKIPAQAIHGDKSQGARQRALSSFKEGKIRVLVATDIAARGIDIDALSHVINFELPNEPETYVHRIGRTGRAGAQGVALSLCDFDELTYLKAIEALTRQKIPVVEENPFPMERFEPVPKQPRPPRPPRTGAVPEQKAADAGTQRQQAASCRNDEGSPAKKSPRRRRRN